ncbi:unnamed protein product [Protopolystoma xenopodis]|uniref:Uncharacterized protein n=1 Tax=Protopolystoma xenopodis TaxID=117903 RepID=A0A448XNE2_9PLAT|nr:unnamed protein product [Protopolystoma xenopodis]
MVLSISVVQASLSALPTSAVAGLSTALHSLPWTRTRVLSVDALADDLVATDVRKPSQPLFASVGASCEPAHLSDMTSILVAVLAQSPESRGCLEAGWPGREQAREDRCSVAEASPVGLEHTWSALPVDVEETLQVSQHLEARLGNDAQEILALT